MVRGRVPDARIIGPLLGRLGTFTLALALVASCSGARPSAGVRPRTALPEPRRSPRLVSPPEWYWEGVDPDLRDTVKGVEVPVLEASLVRIEGATRVWDELGVVGRERLRRDGLVVVAGEPRPRMGAFYTELRNQRVPYVVTLDALTYLLHVAFERALAEVDDTLLAPALAVLLERLEARLVGERKGAGVELGEGLGLARAIVAVARGLLRPGLSADAAVAHEIALVQAHAGPQSSPLLGAPIDYARFAPPADAAHPAAFQALAWLASAPLLFVAESEAKGAVVGVGASRQHARAAMALSRLALREVDPEIHALWSRLTRLQAFVWGASDDVAPAELADIASSIGLSLEDPNVVANVVTVDRLRRRVAQGRAPAVFDGSGAPGRAGIGLRLFGGHAGADAIALASLVGPALGVTTVIPSPALARAGTRALPSSLDLAAWLGAKEGRDALRVASLDAFPGYDAALARAIATRPPEGAPSRHASVHGSLLDVTMTWLSAEGLASRPLASAAARSAAVESALAAWTYARHDGAPLTRPALARGASTKELVVKGASLPAFVEQAPDVIARLVGTAVQMRRGLAAVGGLPTTSPTMVALAEVEDLLRLSLRVAEHEANDEALSEGDATALGGMPARLARVEEEAHASVPLLAELMVDAAGRRVLSTATGGIEPVVMIVAEPGSDRLLLAVGAHVAQEDVIESRDARTSDTSRREQMVRAVGQTMTGRGLYTVAFRMVR